MSDPAHPIRRTYHGVMVSSTFLDLEEHRKVLVEALGKEDLHFVGMESYVVEPDHDLISSSLAMVEKASGYIGLISRRYGQTPDDARNPSGLSISELEFEKAQALGLPTLMFLMGEKHPITEADVEIDPLKRDKLAAYRERAKKGRIWVEFQSREQFTKEAIHAVARLRRYFEEQDRAADPVPIASASSAAAEKDAIPTPPALYAEPRYIASHEFVGRWAELEALDDWAAPADPHPVLLFDAIGGTGKSFLTWHWLQERAPRAAPWAGIFWYSFYEKGAVLADFLRRALAYMTGTPLATLRKKRTPELSERLLAELGARPWLLVLDGLERVLVSYHRLDAAGMRDEEAGAGDPIGEVTHRDPCAAIRPEDDELLRQLAGGKPSKILVTSRLVPRVLVNAAGQPIPGVLRTPLRGLRPADAEELLRAAGVRGDSAAIQTYLQEHCDCHPLVTGVVAGLVNHHLPAPGDFDAWAQAADGGGRLNLGALDLIQKRNDILDAAFRALPPKSRELLATLALVSQAVDYPTLAALNPHLPPEIGKVEEPIEPEKRWEWEWLSDEQKAQVKYQYPVALERFRAYQLAVEARRRSPELAAAPKKLQETVLDLGRRGLLQHDLATNRFDLHPVVRGVASGRLDREETDRYGQKVVDYFSQVPHNPYEKAETLEDVQAGLEVVRAYLRMERWEAAADAYRGDLARALLVNLEAHTEILKICRAFFPLGWGTGPEGLSDWQRSYLATYAGFALQALGFRDEVLVAYETELRLDLEAENWSELPVHLGNVGSFLSDSNRLARAEICTQLVLALAEQLGDAEEIFAGRLLLAFSLARRGAWEGAEELWALVEAMERPTDRSKYRQGELEVAICLSRFWQGRLQAEKLAAAERLTRAGQNRPAIRSLHCLRGLWRLERREWRLAAESLHEAVRMARDVGLVDSRAETLFALAKMHRGELPEPAREAERLAGHPHHRSLAELWLAIGDRERATEHALAAYRGAWADGEPYVWRWQLDKSRELLTRLGVPIPELPPYDPAKDEKFPWEDQVAAVIERLRLENEEKR